MTTKLLIDRELLERIDESAICDGTDATISDDLFTQLVGALDAPVQWQAVAYVLFRDGEPFYEADNGIVISNTPGDETYLYKWLPVYTTPPQPAEVGELADLLREVREYGTRRPAPKGHQILERIDAALAKLEGKV